VLIYSGLGVDGLLVLGLMFIFGLRCLIFGIRSLILKKKSFGLI